MSDNQENNSYEQDQQFLERLQFIKGVGPKRAAALVKEGLKTSYDLLTYFPRAYIDRSGANSIKQASFFLFKQNELESSQTISDFSLSPEITIIGRIISIHERAFGKSRKMLKIVLSDGSGVAASIIFWNRIQSFKNFYKEGMILAVSGKPQQDKFNSISFTHPEIDVIDAEEEDIYKSGGIIPKYRISENMASAAIALKTMRVIMRNIINEDLKFVTENLPNEILSNYGLPDIRETIKNLHFPESKEKLESARFRVKFEEIFYFLLRIELGRLNIKITEQGIVINPKSKLARQLYDSLGFELTSDQKKFLRDVAEDMSGGKPMNRLLQGDVGSGKTIVALLSILMVVDSGYQCCFMAPTEILAEQHFKTISKYLEPFGVEVAQLVGGQKTRVRNYTLEKIMSGSASVIVGTHALFQSEIEYNKLGLIVIDEQHRFGVEQRADLIKLSQKSHGGQRIVPHVLVMSATPIPRTLTMTVYGDLDVSIIKTMPKNRKPILTKVIFDSQLEEVFTFLRNEITKGRQGFVVYPLVEKSDKIEFKAATEHFEHLRTEIFPDLKLGLLHGQMFWYEKDEAMQSFLAKEYDILVATTVIEVGIDIPNASVMVIEDAERFGLSQLHQLRGRVGRGAEQSYCFLITKDKFKYKMKSGGNDESERTAAIVRLKTMEETSDGFKISEVDLKLRGPGDVLGTRQSGLPDFKYLDLINDHDIIAEAKQAAADIISTDPKLNMKKNEILRNELYKRFGRDKSFLNIA
ncbi:MAG: ATP-dependent DNA helicase RecG [Candidatus Kapabacteria bacterium]|nr:ATP-dependent DNA helicase RecG [Ignavibacteriota bacterium]MCW5884732.1 ATP-dependent DNA helicase RecG [Candidatus Kapabacteria bacterium]